MKPYVKVTLLLSLLAIVSWGMYFLSHSYPMDLFSSCAGCFFTLLTFCLLIICMVRALGKKASAYRIFAITNGILAVLVTGYAVYDILTDTGWFAGLLGVILLVYVVPVFLVLLLLDFIVWKISRRVP